jgi:hypothetical protein
MRTKYLLIGAVVLLIFLPIWYFSVVPGFERIGDDFSYEAQIFSVDRFYDEDLQKFSEGIISKTKFSYEVLSRKGKVLEVKNIFDVRKIDGEKIFSVERVYAIDINTVMHVAGLGDKDRSGYLFGPKKSDKNNFIYWHVNYDAPAEMKFKNEEMIYGLKTYKFETNYYSDQTFLLDHLPGVPEVRGVGNDINLILWIEPNTGRMIKYEDNTEAFYYDINDKEKLSTWNHFNNKYTEDSVKQQVLITKNILFQLLLIKTVIPLLLVVSVVIITLFFFLKGEVKK